jgi:hypothetical protein
MTAGHRAAFVWALLGLSACVHPGVVPSGTRTSQIGRTTQISQSGRGAYEVSLAVGASRIAAAWYDTRDGNPEIYLRLLDPEGRPAGAEHRLTDDLLLSYEADIDLIGGEVVVAWYDRAPDGRLRAQVGRWTVDGTRRWVRPLSAHTGDARNPQVVVDGDRMFCVWIEADQAGQVAVWARWLDGAGEPVTSPERLAPAGDTTWNLNATLDDDGEAWVVFDAAVDTRADELFLVRTTPGHREVARLTADDGFASKYPDLALAGDRAALTWFDERDGNQEIYLFAAPSAGLEAGVEAALHRVTDTPGDSFGAYVAWNERRVGVAWSDAQDSQSEVYFQSFDPDGRPLESPRRLTNNTTASLIPAVEPWGDGFVLAWNEDVVAERGNHEAGGRSEIVFIYVE